MKLRVKEIRVNKKSTKGDEGEVIKRRLGVGSAPNLKTIRIVKNKKCYCAIVSASWWDPRP